MRRVLVLAAVLVGAVVVQSAVLAGVRLAGVRPDLLVLAVVAVAMASDATTGAVLGFAAGLAADLLFDLPVGVSALVYTAVGFAVGTVRVYVTSHLPLVHLVLAGAASLVPRVAVRPYATLSTLDVVAIVVERPSRPRAAPRPAAVGSPGGGGYSTRGLTARVHPQPTRWGG